METTGNQIELPTTEGLLQILLNFLSGDNQKIAASTQFLKAYTKLADCVAPLLTIMIQATDAGLRQFASILLKRNITIHYLALNPQQRKEFRDTILGRYFEEPEKIVRRNIGNLIAVVAKVALRDKEWNELMTVLSEKTHASQPLQVRASGLNLLSVILDISGEYLDENYAQLSVFLAQTISDQSSEIRIQTLKCLILMFDSVSEKEHLEFFQNLVEPCLKVIDECITLKDDETPLLAFDVFCVLAECYNPILTDDNILKILTYICSDRVLLNNNLGPNARECAMDFLAEVACEHKSIITKNATLLKHLIECVFVVTCNKSKEEDFEDASTIQDIGLLLLREFANVLPKKKVYPHFKTNIKILMDSGSDEKIEAALLILGHISEGCCEYLKRDLNNPIMNDYIGKGLASNNTNVKSAAIYALCYFAEFLLPDILAFHKVIVPNLLSNFNHLSSKVSERAIFTIDIFCENMEDEISQYLDLLVPQLVNTLDNSNSTMTMRRFCISAITSIISACGEKFVPYAELTIKLMSELLKIKDVSLIGLRAEATTCLGKLAVAICKENRQVFQTYITPLIDVVYDGMVNVDDYEIREHSYAFFYCIASILGEEFQPILSKIVEHAFKSIASKEGLTKVKQQTEDFSLGSDSEDEDEELEPGQGVKVQMSWLDEKAAAIHALGEFAVSCYKGFAPYYEQTLTTLDSLVEYFYANVRQQVVVCYKNLTESLVKSTNNGQIPAYQSGLPCVQRFDDKVEEFIKIELHTKLFHFLQLDESREVCAATLEVLTDLVKNLGPAVIDKSLDELVKTINILLNNQATCQGTDADDDGEGDVNGLIFGNLTELIPVLAKALLDGFGPIFKEIYPNLKQYAKPTRNIDDIAQVIGIFAEVFKYVPSLVPHYGLDVISLLQETKELGDDEINRNVAFCYGNICELGGETFYTQYYTILEHLKFIFDNAFIPECSDNAVSALAKMIYTNSHLIPLNIVLPAIFKVIPLKGDLEEEKVIIKMILFLFDTNLAILTGFEDVAVGVLIDGLMNRNKYKLNEELQTASKIVLKKLMEDANWRKIVENNASKLDQSQLIELDALLKQDEENENYYNKSKGA